MKEKQNFFRNLNKMVLIWMDVHRDTSVNCKQ